MFDKVKLFRVEMERELGGLQGEGIKLDGTAETNPGPIQGVLTSSSSSLALELEGRLKSRGIDVRAARPPAVKAGEERIRIVVHYHNTSEQIARFARVMGEEVRDILGSRGGGQG